MHENIPFSYLKIARPFVVHMQVFLIKQMVHMQLIKQTVDFDLSIMNMLALNFSLRIEIRWS